MQKTFFREGRTVSQFLWRKILYTADSTFLPFLMACIESKFYFRNKYHHEKEKQLLGTLLIRKSTQKFCSTALDITARFLILKK